MGKKFIPRTFTIPDTIEGLVGFLTAQDWERAALVYAWTYNDGKGRPKKNAGTTALFSLKDFADLGIYGLTDRNTVGAYRQAWVWAVENDLADMVEPGDEIDFGDLATVDFPPTSSAYGQPHPTLDAKFRAEADRAGITPDAVRRTAANKSAAKAAFKADPEFRKAIHEAESEQVQELAEKTQQRRRSVVDPQPKPSTPIDDAVSAMDGVIEEATRREYLETGLQMAVAMHEWALEFAENYGHTGVADEVEKVHQISYHLTEAQWKIAAFAVEEQEGAK